ncbi:MAG: ATP-binding protein [Desulfatibacillaceae bacterium]|nr:ATP-binding protein [Desulfatibacillaceae bacterium]
MEAGKEEGHSGKNRPLAWFLFWSYLLIALLCVAGVAWYSWSVMKHYYIDQARDMLKARALILEEELKPFLMDDSPLSADPQLRKLGQLHSTRITLISLSGKVIGDSQEASWQMDNHAARPEVAAALEGGTGVSTRYSNTVQKHMVYVALPIQHEGGMIGVLRMAIPVTALDEALKAMSGRILLGAFFILLLAAGVSMMVSTLLARPLQALTRGATRYARGDFSLRLAHPAPKELARLALAMNQMAAQLFERISTITRQKNEMEAVLSSMMEGVIAVDKKGLIISMNQAAARLFGRQPAAFTGLLLESVTRNKDFSRFVQEGLESGVFKEADITLYMGGSSKILHTRNVALHDSDGAQLGMLLVINDVTRLRSLENMRRDFVSNVSHEIRTPLTAIKGFVETLVNDGLEDKDQSGRFLEIVLRHVDRLNNIVEDLLALSRMEHEDARKKLSMQPCNLNQVVQAARSICLQKAAAKQISITLATGEPVMAFADCNLVEQAVVNLLDNAIKYSNPGSIITLSTGSDEGYSTICCEDQGIGIASEHLPRVFERFYRVDKARSRQMGGTGLGLAIVKHIAQAHGGFVKAQSELGRGSVFSIHLPARQEETA